MTTVEPKVYLLAETKFVSLEEPCATALEWLTDLGADFERVMQRMEGSDAERLVELAARRCYKSFEVGLNPNVTKIREDSRSYHENILRSAHGSVLEHANFTMAFEFVSRVFTHELVRHRAGCAYSQESLRYVRLTELGFWMPPEIRDNPQAAALFTQTVEALESAQRGLELLFHDELQGEFSTKKKLTSAFRRIAPEGLSTGIVATFNARAFRHIAKMRTDSSAEAEIRLAIGKACDILFARHPMLFQDFEAQQSDGLDERVPKYKKV